jgi:hypothetical protein
MVAQENTKAGKRKSRAATGNKVFAGGVKRGFPARRAGARAGQSITTKARHRAAISQPQSLLPMQMLIPALPVAAAGWSLLYLLFGGGLAGAVVIFIVAKLFGK